MERFYEVLTQNKVTSNVQISRWDADEVVLAGAALSARLWHAHHTHQPLDRIEVVEIHGPTIASMTMK